MLYTHNWWHVALYYLALGNTTRVLELYDTQIWGRANQEQRKIRSARLPHCCVWNYEGLTWAIVGMPESISAISPPRSRFALSRICTTSMRWLAWGQLDWLREMLTSQQAHAATVHSDQRYSWTEIAIPAARGLVAHAQGDWSGTIAELQAVLPRLQTIGGSQTQRALFEQIYRDALHKHDRQPVIYAIATLSAV
jgi:hypothetical protein